MCKPWTDSKDTSEVTAATITSLSTPSSSTSWAGSVPRALASTGSTQGRRTGCLTVKFHLEIHYFRIMGGKWNLIVLTVLIQDKTCPFSEGTVIVMYSSGPTLLRMICNLIYSSLLPRNFLQAYRTTWLKTAYEKGRQSSNSEVNSSSGQSDELARIG